MYTLNPLMIKKVQKWGNSLGVRLPRAVTKEARIEAGSEVDVQLVKGEIVLRPVRRKKYNLADMLAQIDPDNLPEKIDWGPPVGKEVW